MDKRQHVDLRARLAAMRTPELLRTVAKHQRREELVPEAYAAVQSILRERRVAVEEAVASILRDWPDPDAAADLVVVATAFNPTRAQLIRMRLEEAGLEVQMADENLPRIHYGYGIAAGGVKVLVRAGDVEVARTILAEPPLQFHWPCPSCGSRDTSRDVRLLRGVTIAVGLMFATPEPQLARTGQCNACGHTWEGE
jgi:hypothetical protein